MTTLLTIDDSRDVRAAVSRSMRELGFEVLQAEDGEQGLAVLAARQVDVVLLDVTMPVMDGPAMLRALRGRGDRTPVIMMTSECRRAIVAEALHLGIDDYILKPFRPDELRTKVLKAAANGEVASAARRALEATAPPPPVLAAGSGVIALPPTMGSGLFGAPAATAPAPVEVATPRPRADVLIVDDMEHVHKRLRQALPEHVSLHGAVGADDAATRCREHTYRLILIDLVIPDVDSLALAAELRALQPDAVFVAVAMRTIGGARGEAPPGFADVVVKPFDPDGVAALVERLGEGGDLLSVDGNVIVAAGCDAKDEQLDRHHARLRAAVLTAIEPLAAAGHHEVILDLRQVPLRPERTVATIVDVDHDVRQLGLRLRLVCTSETASLLRRVADTADITVFDSVDRARGMAA
jgi:DNA-binding response OmpR family regulator